MNIELLKKVRDYTLANPADVDMHVRWLEPRFHKEASLLPFVRTREVKCGTVGCIGGNAIRLSGGVLPELRGKSLSENYQLAFFAARTLLGLTEKQARSLFMLQLPENTVGTIYEPLTARLLIQRAGTPEYAAIVAEAIDLCIAQAEPTAASEVAELARIAKL